AELGAHVADLDVFPVFIFSLERDFAGFRLPLPGVRKLEYSGNFPVPRIADRLNFVPRIDAVGLGDLFENWRARLRQRNRGKSEYCKTQDTQDQANRFCHESPSQRE